MYYSEYARVKKLEGWLAKLAYISVGLDFVISLATLLILKGLTYSKFMLTIGNYLLTAEMIVIGVIFVSIVLLKHYSNMMSGFALAAFKNVKVRRARHTFKRVVFSPALLVKRAFAHPYGTR